MSTSSTRSIFQNRTSTTPNLHFKYYTEPSFEETLGLPVAYRREGSGEAVVFLHGAGYTRRWLPMYQMMADRVDFIAPEAPGFGETALPASFRDFSDLVILYDQFLAQLGLEEIHLIGYSMGGWAAAEFASYYPSRVKSLTLITPIGLRLEGNPGGRYVPAEPAGTDGPPVQ